MRPKPKYRKFKPGDRVTWSTKDHAYNVVEVLPDGVVIDASPIVNRHKVYYDQDICHTKMPLRFKK